MSFNAYTSLMKINPSKIKWKIRVRAQAIWRGITRETQEFRGLNIIFLDDSNCRIHAFVNARFAELFEDNLQEGEIYNLCNFMVQDYTGMESHRCVRLSKHIYFAEYTKLQKASNDGLKIQPWAFDLFSLSDLDKMEVDKRFLCDVVGIIKDTDPIREYVTETNEQKTQKNFSITDGSYTVNVTFFDKIAEDFEKALSKESVEPNFIIISSAKIGRFQGDLNLTNYPATRFYFNINHYSIKHMKKRYSQGLLYKKLPENLPNKYNIMTVKEIKELTEQHIEKQVMCQVTLKKVDENVDWFIRVCTKCGDELNLEEDGRYKCDECVRSFSWPDRRFRVCTVCVDPTGSIPIVLGDHEIRRLTGKTVFDFDLDEADGLFEGKYPPILQALKDKEYKITLVISAENVKKKCNIYKSSDIAWDTEDYLGSNKPLNNPSRDNADQEIEKHLQFTEADNKSANTQSSSSKIHVSKSLASEEIDPLKNTWKNREIVDLKKGKLGVKISKKFGTPKSARGSSSKQLKQILENKQYDPEEHISLNKLSKLSKKKVKEQSN